MTMMANDHQVSSVKDADDLFIKLSVPDLNVYERKIRADIENKKQELRTMVGERYRDLIGAADRIVRMKETALQVQSNMARMRESCDVHSLKRRVSAKTTNGGGAEVDGTKKAFYSSAAQIKLLVDAPEQIWRNMESHNYLTASRLYLISKAIHRNLRPDEHEMDEQKKKVMESFPVVGRQWDAVRHFKTQILNKSTHRLREESLSDQVVIETLAAIMLLDDVTMKDMLRLLLTQRQEAMLDILQNKGKQHQQDIGAQLVQAIDTFKATLMHVDAAFRATGSDNQSRLERHLRHLEQTFSSPIDDSMPAAVAATAGYLGSSPLGASALSVVPSSDTLAPPSSPTIATTTQAVIPQLYPTTPNIHLLARYLPDSVQTFTPFIHLHGPHTQFSQQDMRQGLQAWVQSALSMFGDEFERLLQKALTTKHLVRIRSAVWDAIRQDELKLIVGKKTKGESLTVMGSSSPSAFGGATAARMQPTLPPSPPSWDTVCHLLLGKSLSLWETVLRAGFRKAFQDIIVFALEELSKQPQSVLRTRLAELDHAESPDRNVGRFVWHEGHHTASVATGATVTGNATHGKKMATPSLSASVTATANANILATATGPLAARIRECVSGWTSLVADTAQRFETHLLDIRLDQEHVLVLCKKDVYGRRRQPHRQRSVDLASPHRQLSLSHSQKPEPADTESGPYQQPSTPVGNEADSDSDSSDDNDDSEGESDEGEEERERRWAESGGEGLFGVVADQKALLDFYQSRSMQCVQAYRVGLDRLVQEALQKPEGARNTLTAMDRAMAVGRLAACLASLAPFFRQVLLPPAVEQQQRQQRRLGTSVQRSLAAAREDKTEVDQYALQMAQGFHEVYLAAHQTWIDHMGWLLNKRLEEAYLYDRLTCASVWSSDLATLSWEPMATAPSTSDASPLSPTARRTSLELLSPTASSSSSSGNAGKTLLPFHASTKLLMVLEGVVQEMHRIGAGSMRPDLVQRLATHLATVAYEAVIKFLDTVVAAESELHQDKKKKDEKEPQQDVITLTEKGALQLLFDVKYLALCFQASANRDDKVAQLASSAQDRVKQHIDPINLEVFEGPIDKNVDQQYQRTWTMLGLLVQLNKKPAQSTKKKVETGAHHVLAMAPLSTRFTLLPIGQRMSSRVA